MAKSKKCKKCSGPISGRGKTGLCSSCAKRFGHNAMVEQPEVKEKWKESIRKTIIEKSISGLAKDSIPIVITYNNGHVEVMGIKSNYARRHPDAKVLNVELYNPTQKEAIADKSTEFIEEFIKDKPVEELDVEEEVGAPKDWPPEGWL